MIWQQTQSIPPGDRCNSHDHEKQRCCLHVLQSNAKLYSYHYTVTTYFGMHQPTTNHTPQPPKKHKHHTPIKPNTNIPNPQKPSTNTTNTTKTILPSQSISPNRSLSNKPRLHLPNSTAPLQGHEDLHRGARSRSLHLQRPLHRAAPSESGRAGGRFFGPAERALKSEKKARGEKKQRKKCGGFLGCKSSEKKRHGTCFVVFVFAMSVGFFHCNVLWAVFLFACFFLFVYLLACLLAACSWEGFDP